MYKAPGALSKYARVTVWVSIKYWNAQRAYLARAHFASRGPPGSLRSPVVSRPTRGLFDVTQPSRPQ